MKFSTLLLLAASLGTTASAQIGLDDTPVTLDFNDFRGAGFAPAPTAGQLSSNHFDVIGNAGPLANRPSTFGDTQATGVFARGASAGGVTDEGVYAFETASGDYALGIQPNQTFFGPGASGGSGGYIHVRFQNTTNRTLTAVTVQGEIKVLNNGNRSTSIGVALVPDVVISGGQEQSRGVSRVVVNNLPTPGAATSGGWTTTPFDTTVDDVEISPGENFYVRAFVSDNPQGPSSGDRDEFAIDNLTVATASGVAVEDGASGETVIRSLFPNPATASASAQVAFSTQRSERVTVQVYDAVGRLVATAFDGPTSGGAETLVALPASLAPGTYVVRLAGETFTSQRLLTVVR